MSYDKTKGPWNDGSYKPHMEGVYQRCPIFGPIHYSYWNGISWSLPDTTAVKAYLKRNSGRSAFQALTWRGLANEPK